MVGEGVALGALAAMSGHPEYLVENLFGSEPCDFRRWGVYTCRFYRDGEWREVVTDTRLPWSTGQKKFVSGQTMNKREMWVPLLLKAYAKLCGSYDAFGSIADALVDFTGGAVETLGLRDATRSKNSDVLDGLWDRVLLHTAQKDVLCSTAERGRGDELETPQGLLPERAYCVEAVKEIGETRFVVVRNPWHSGTGTGDWRGPWSNASPQWDDFPEVLNEIAADDTLRPYVQSGRVDTRSGTFFMTFDDFCANFHTLHVCRLFPDDQYTQYKAHGIWQGKTAGGGAIDELNALSNKKVAKVQQQTAKPEDGETKTTSLFAALQKQPSPPKDDNPWWFNNPQYRVCTALPVDVYISLLQYSHASSPTDDDAKAAERRTKTTMQYEKLAFEVFRSRKAGQSLDKGRIFAVDGTVEVVHWTKPQDGPAQRQVGATIHLEPGWHYGVVVHTVARGREAPFVLRIFSPSELTVQRVPETSSLYVPGAWKAPFDGGSSETAGGPPFQVVHDKLKHAPRWCLNPQYVVKLADDDDGTSTTEKKKPESSTQHGRSAVDVKLVLRRTDLDTQRATDEAALPKVGLVVCKAQSQSSTESDEPRFATKKKEPKTNALGEPLPSKMSTLKKKRPSFGFLDQRGWASPTSPPTSPTWDSSAKTASTVPDRKVVLDPTDWHATSDFGDPAIATLYLPSVPVARLARGLVVVPSLTEADLDGTFVLEVHADVPLTVTASPEARSKTLVGEWRKSNAGGSHLHPTWAQNPKYKLSFHSGASKAKVDIALSRRDHGGSPGNKKNNDMVGSMIGFYLSRGHSLHSDDNAISTFHFSRCLSNVTFSPRRCWHLSPREALERITLRSPPDRRDASRLYPGSPGRLRRLHNNSRDLRPRETRDLLPLRHLGYRLQPRRRAEYQDTAVMSSSMN